MHATLCDLIMDLTQNSIEADATQIDLHIEESNNEIRVDLRDNGKGMSAEILEKAKDPFYSDGKKHVHRKVGLGLPFLFQTADMTQGTACIESKEGIGTTLSVRFNTAHMDLPQFGSFTSMATALLSYEFAGNLTLKHTINTQSYTLDKDELVEALGSLNDIDGLSLLKQFIQSNENEIGNIDELTQF